MSGPDAALPGRGEPVRKGLALGKPATAERPLAQRLGTNLGDLRRRRGLSQAALARRIGRGRTAVCRWESGERLPTLAAFFALTVALACDPSDLLGAEVPPS